MLEERLKSARKATGISQKDIAKKLFISQQAYAKYETGAATPNPETLKRIAEIFNVSTDYLLGNNQVLKKQTKNPAVVKIPVLGEVAAGVPIFADENIIDYEEIPAEMAKNDDYFALKIHGDSMEPRIWNNDVVIVRKQSDVDSGDIAIVIVNGDLGTCKKVVKHSSGISLISFNSKYEPMFYTTDEIKTLPLTIIGKVVELRGKL